MITREELLTDIQEIRSDYWYSFSNKRQARAVSLKKQWIKNCAQLVAISKTLLEFKEAYFECPDESKPKTDAYYGWLSLCLESVANAKTSDEVMDVLRDAPDAIDLQESALAKRIQLCTTWVEAKKGYVDSTPGSYESDQFLSKCIKLGDKTQLNELMGGLSSGSTAKAEVRERLKQLEEQE